MQCCLQPLPQDRRENPLRVANDWGTSYANHCEAREDDRDHPLLLRGVLHRAMFESNRCAQGFRPMIVLLLALISTATNKRDK